MNINFGLIELLFFYGIAIGVAYFMEEIDETDYPDHLQVICIRSVHWIL